MDRKVYPGGLMRCCLQSLYEDDETPNEEGETIQCKYTADPLHNMIFRGDGWHWTHPEPESKVKSTDK